MTFHQIAVLVFIFIYYGILLGFRAWLLYKNTGLNAIKGIPKEGIFGFNEKVILFCFILISVIGFNFAFIPQNYPLLGPIVYLEKVSITKAGFLMAGFGLLFTFIAQLQMGNSWRLGTDEKETTALITHGLYRFSRNPVYLGILIALLGYFLMLPNAFSLCLWALMFIAVNIKIRLEEAFLLRKHPETFTVYKSRVRRWL